MLQELNLIFHVCIHAIDFKRFLLDIPQDKQYIETYRRVSSNDKLIMSFWQRII
jgi:hypothetical protein